MKTTCKQCSKNFTSYASDNNGNGRKYCSRKCYWENGRVKTDEERMQISNTMKRKGLKPQLWGKWKTPCGMLGKTHSIETRLKMSKSHPRRPYGKTKYSTERKMEMARIEYSLWRKSVFERDDYTCQFCGIRGGKIQADHIIPWVIAEEKRYEIENGRTLCIKCHKKTDTWGAKAINFLYA